MRMALGARAGPSLKRFGQQNKSRIRTFTRRFGYEITPFRTSATEHTIRLLIGLGIDLLVDVGANEGQYAERMRAYGYSGRIVSFEPSAAAATRLRRRASLDPLWEVRTLAVGNSPGSATLHVSGNSVSSSLLDMETSHANAAPESTYVGDETVDVVRLDDSLTVQDSRIWLKIDVQGTEREVLEGSESLLRQVKVIETELSVVSLYKGQTLLPEMLSLLREYGFTLVRFERGLEDPVTGNLLQLDGVFARTRDV